MLHTFHASVFPFDAQCIVYVNHKNTILALLTHNTFIAGSVKIKLKDSPMFRYCVAGSDRYGR